MQTKIELKVCTRCGVSKPATLEFFYARSRGGARNPCKDCTSRRDKETRASDPEKYRQYRRAIRKPGAHRWYQIKFKYGIDKEDYDRMVEAQGGRCASCSRGCDPLHIGHDHTTSKVRALLCGGCNRALGILREDPEIIRALATYISNFKGEHRTHEA